MKILHICMTQYSDGWTYHENILSKYHRLAKHEVIILTSLFCYNKGKLVKDVRKDFIDLNGCRVIRLDNKKQGFMKKLPKYEGFYKAIEKIKPDIIFSHGCQYRDIKSVANYVKLHPETTLYIDNHADFSNSATNFFSKMILHKIIWKYYAKIVEPVTQKFFGVLPARVDFLINVYKIPREKCDLLVMGGDDELIKKSSSEEIKKLIRNKYNIKKEDFLIVTGGKIDVAKIQILNLMKAIKNLNNKKIKLLIFGPVVPELKESLDLLTDGVIIQQVGWISPEKTYEFFSAADLVIFPGRHSVFWEQVVAQGIPMLVKEWAGTNHVNVCGNVIFLKNDNVFSIQENIKNLIENPNLYNQIKNAALKAMNTFSYKEIAKKSIEEG